MYLEYYSINEIPRLFQLSEKLVSKIACCLLKYFRVFLPIDSVGLQQVLELIEQFEGGVACHCYNM